MNQSLRLCALLVLMSSACSGGASPQRGDSAAAAPAADEISAWVDQALGPGPVMAPRSTGVPHSNNIDAVALSLDGRHALSRDALGGVRYWPSLDGKTEPLLVPVRGARSMSVEAAASGAIIAAVDAVGSLHVMRANADGSMAELFMTSPHYPMVQAVVLPGGTHVVALEKEHRLRLFEATGAALAQFEKRRFRPQALRVSADGKTLVAISAEPLQRGLTLSMQRFQIDLQARKTRIVPVGDEVNSAGAIDLDANRLALSPDGARLAHLAFPTPADANAPAPSTPPNPPVNVSPVVAAVTDLATGATSTVPLTTPAHEILVTSLGFVGPSTLVIGSRPSGGSWRVDLDKGNESYPISSPAAQDTRHGASAFADGLRLAADGTWLFVQELPDDKHHYLGYAAFDPQAASISPSGSHVAWSNGMAVFVEPISGGGQAARISAPPQTSYMRAAFLDQERIVSVDYSGALHVVEWKSGKELAEMDMGGGISDFEIDTERKLVRGTRQNGGAWLLEVDGAALKGPHWIQDGSIRSGFLSGSEVIWTLDNQSRYRTYKLAELRRGLSGTAMSARGEVLKDGFPLNVGRDGQFFYSKADAQGAYLGLRKVLGEEVSIRLPSSPMLLAPSPDGKRIALAIASNVLHVYDASTAKVLWSESFVQGVHHLNWSQDSSSLAVASQVGAVVYDAASGEVKRKNCSPWFERRSTPPPSTLSFMAVENLCER